MKPYQYASSPRDTVEALTFLHADTSVTVTVGASTYTYTAPAGVSAQTFPLELGTVSAKFNSTTITSPLQGVASPYVQDLDYYMIDSLGVS